MAQTAADFFNFPTVDIKVFLKRVEEEFEDDMKAQREYELAMSQAKSETDKLEMRAKLGKKRIPYPMLMLGKAGIGKTQGISELCAKRGWGFKEMRLVNFTETDLIGIPYKDEHGMTQYATNALFPNVERGDPEYGIILVDEFTSAPSNIQVPILQLTDSSRSIGNYHLPDGWKIVLAGNGPGDGGTFRSLPGTVISRASCYYVITSTEAWLDYAMLNSIHRSIRAYIGSMRTDISGAGDTLHGYKEDEDTGYEKAFPCPRTWEKLSRFLYDLDKRYPGWQTPEVQDRIGGNYVNFLVASCIGSTAANAFLAFIAYEKDIVSAEAICKANDAVARAKLPRLDSLDPGAKYLTVCTLADYLCDKSEGKVDVITGTVDKSYIQMFANALNWVFEGVADPTSEEAMFAVTDISQRNNHISMSLTQSPEFIQLCPTYSKLKAKTVHMLQA